MGEVCCKHTRHWLCERKSLGAEVDWSWKVTFHSHNGKHNPLKSQGKKLFNPKLLTVNILPLWTQICALPTDSSTVVCPTGSDLSQKLLVGQKTGNICSNWIGPLVVLVQNSLSRNLNCTVLNHKNLYHCPHQAEFLKFFCKFQSKNKHCPKPQKNLNKAKEWSIIFGFHLRPNRALYSLGQLQNFPSKAPVNLSEVPTNETRMGPTGFTYL